MPMAPAPISAAASIGQARDAAAEGSRTSRLAMMTTTLIGTRRPVYKSTMSGYQSHLHLLLLLLVVLSPTLNRQQLSNK